MNNEQVSNNNLVFFIFTMSQNIQHRSLEFGIEIAKYYLSLKEKKYYEIAS